MKKTMLSFMLVFLFVFTENNVFAQFVPTAVQSSNTVIQNLCEEVEPHGWLYFKDDTELDPDSYFNTYGTDMGLGVNDEMIKIDEWEGECQTHFRFQQYHKSIPVKYGEYIIHAKYCRSLIAHGKLVEQLNISLPATISEATALQNALNDIGANTYAWQDADWEFQAQEDMEDPNATWYPEGELEIYGEADVDMTASNFDLAYRFEIFAIDPYDSRIVYVDAHNGQILANIDEHHHATGTCTTLYYGTRTIETKDRGWPHNDFILKDHTRGQKIWTKKVNNITSPWAFIPDVTDDNNSWGTPNAPSTTAHWAAEMAWDYFLNEWGWEGCNGSGRQLRLLTEVGTLGTTYKPKKRKDLITVSSNGGADDATLDIIGHEFTHGVAHHKAKLGPGTSEAAALAESFGDIFGEAIERDVLGSNDWLFGGDNGAVRDLATPSTFSHPNTYMGTFWDLAGEPHTNAGVQNKWFNLLSVGGTQNGVTVAGIGFDKAIRVVHGNLFNNMSSGSNYVDARSGAISVATTIWGACSNETIQTTNAWAACGVGSVFSSLCPLNISGPGSVCTDFPNGESWIATALPGITVTWSYPTWWDVTISGVGNKKLALNGYYSLPPLPTTVVITATSSSGGSDTYSIFIEECIIPPCEGDGGQYLIAPNSDIDIPEGRPKDKINIFPNPSFGKLTITNEALMESSYDVKIINMLGNVVLKRTANGSIFELNVESLATGIYYLKIDHPDFQEIKSFVKK